MAAHTIARHAKRRASFYYDGKSKECWKCRKIRVLDDFSSDPHSFGGKSTYCRGCYKARNNITLFPRRFGITVEERENLLCFQNKSCALCGILEENAERALAIDHNHACHPKKRGCKKCIRGLLCTKCNVGLDWLEQNVVLQNSFVKTYLQNRPFTDGTL